MICIPWSVLSLTHTHGQLIFSPPPLFCFNNNHNEQEAYGALAVEKGEEVDEAVLEMWEARRRDCMRRLGSWGPLKEDAEEAAARAEEEMAPVGRDVGATYDLLWRHERRRQERGAFWFYYGGKGG